MLGKQTFACSQSFADDAFNLSSSVTNLSVSRTLPKWFAWALWCIQHLNKQSNRGDGAGKTQIEIRQPRRRGNSLWHSVPSPHHPLFPVCLMPRRLMAPQQESPQPTAHNRMKVQRTVRNLLIRQSAQLDGVHAQRATRRLVSTGRWTSGRTDLRIVRGHLFWTSNLYLFDVSLF